MEPKLSDIIQLMAFLLFPLVLKFLADSLSGDDNDDLLPIIHGSIISPARSFKLYHENGELVLVWQIPITNFFQKVTDSEFKEMLSDGKPIIMYMHGNTDTEAMDRQISGIYRMLKRECHCVTFESDRPPTELGMKEDGYLVWKWIRKHAPNAKVFVWGHSLGSAAATHLLQDICNEPHPPSGLVLDAPYIKMQDTAVQHSISEPYWPIVSYLKYICIPYVKENFSTIERSLMRLVKF